ncbi:hypothetical protein ACWV2X_08495 [Streptomyces hydrogenans]
MAITVGSVEVDVIPNTQNIYARLRSGLMPSVNRVGNEIGQALGQRITANVSSSVREGIQRAGRQASASAARSGSDAGGAFGRTFRTRLEAAVRSLPDITIGADTSEAESDIRALRSQMERLSNQRVGIDVDAATARRQIELVERQLRDLGRRHPNIDVRVNTAAAVAELSALRMEVNRLDGRDIDIRVDPSINGFRLLTAAAVAFAPAILPALPIVAAGLGAIAAAGTAAAVGIGALGLAAVPAIKDISGALQAQKAAQDAATQSTNAGANAFVRAQQKAIQTASAREALTSATRSLAAAERNAARQIASAQEEVTRARGQAALAAEQAALRSEDAARRVADAERALRDAQQDVLRVQEDLTRARQDAADQLRDLNERLSGAGLEERAAVLRVQEAEAELLRVRKLGVKASQLDRDRAQLGYDQAVAALEQQQAEQARLKAEVEEANRAGVEGSETVRAAQERLQDAQEKVVDRTTDVSDAQAEQVRVAEQNARDIVEAQQRVADAVENVANAQLQAADSVASAQRQVASAQRQVAAAQLETVPAVSAAATAQQKYQEALAKMTPAARDTMRSFEGLRTAFGQWSRSLQPAIMPIFTRALDGLKNSLPGLTPIVLAAAEAVSNLQDRVSAGFKSPWWREFKKDFTASVGPAIEGFGVSFGRIFKGMAGVIQAFLPHMDSISQRMQDITGRFAEWGTSLKGSPAFEGFLSYSSRMLPIVADTLGEVLLALFAVGDAMAPISEQVLEAIGLLATGVQWVADNAPWVIQGIYGIVVAMGAWRLMMLAWRGATLLAAAAMAAFNLVSLAGPWGWIALAIGAVITAVWYLYTRFEWFRDAVQLVWEGIQAGAKWLWEQALKPVFDGIVLALKTVGDWAVWLWEQVLQPVFLAIIEGAQTFITALLTVLVVPFVLAYQLIATVAMWLWEEVLSPVFSWIADKAVWLWKNVLKPTWDAIVAGFEGIGDAVMWVWRNVISPVFGWIGDKANWLWTVILKPTWEAIRQGFRLLGDAMKAVWTDVLKPVFQWVGDKGTWLWKTALKPAFDAIREAMKKVGESFGTAKDIIAEAWSKVADIAKKPVKFVVDKVYNGAIVPTWNLIAGAFGADPLEKMNVQGWATGGVLPGYTPGRDVHRFVSPTGGGLELSGGEAIMRPEFTRAVGGGFVDTMNRLARSRGSEGVKKALAPLLGGNPDMPTQRFADGGIFSWIGNTVAGVGSAAWEKAKGAADWIADSLGKTARAGLDAAVNPLLALFPGADMGFGRMIKRIPRNILDSIFGFSDEADRRGADTIGGPRVQAALRWARTQDGLPYQWGGNGNPSWDCSGFMSAIESVLRGQKPHRRWATMAFRGDTAPPGWVRGADSPFTIGITNAGVGHTAGTLAGVNVESRGGDGVIVGSRARGTSSMLFTDRYGFVPAASYDSGGFLQPGMNLAYNGTGRPEPVLTRSQFAALSGGSATASLGDLHVAVYVGDREITDIARTEVSRSTGELIQVLNAGGGRR